MIDAGRDPVAALATAPLAGGALPAAAPEAGSRRYGVLVGGLRLLLTADGAVRVLEPPPTFRMPNTRGWFLGLSNVRGTLVPVYDLVAWQELTPPESRRMLLVIGQGDAAAGVLVDASPRYLLIPSDAPRAPHDALPAALAEHARESVSIAGATWTDIDWDALFDRLATLALATN